MNKRYTLFLFFTLCTLQLMAQTNRIGLRDSRYLQYTHIFARHFPVTLDHSLYSDNIKMQHCRLLAGYQHQVALKADNQFRFNYSLYYGGLYNGAFQDYGLKIDAEFHCPAIRCILMGTFNPHYDTQLYYSTCYSIGLQFRLNSTVSLFAQSTNIPEYRQPQDRVKAGFSIHVLSSSSRSLVVQPHASIPVNQPYQNTRLHVDFAYLF